MKASRKNRLFGTLPLVALGACLLAATPGDALAGPPPKTVSPVIEPPPASSPFHALLRFDFSTDYITPRGLHIENQGVVFQPLILTFWTLYADQDALINDVTLTLGVWSSFHTNKSGVDPNNWNEFDPILGLGFKFADYWKLDVNYTAFESMTRTYPTSQHLELKLSFDDAALTGSKVFSINPYVAWWKELKNKATVIFNPATSEDSYYFTVGMTPTVNLGKVKFESPTFINIVGSDFYQRNTGAAGGSGLAVLCTGLKVSMPLNFMPKGAGSWTLYAGVKYYHLSNDGLLDGNQVLGADGSRERNLVQWHGGVSIFF